MNSYLLSTYCLIERDFRTYKVFCLCPWLLSLQHNIFAQFMFYPSCGGGYTGWRTLCWVDFVVLLWFCWTILWLCVETPLSAAETEVWIYFNDLCFRYWCDFFLFVIFFFIWTMLIIDKDNLLAWCVCYYDFFSVVIWKKLSTKTVYFSSGSLYLIFSMWSYKNWVSNCIYSLSFTVLRFPIQNHYLLLRKY